MVHRIIDSYSRKGFYHVGETIDINLKDSGIQGESFESE